MAEWPAAGCDFMFGVIKCDAQVGNMVKSPWHKSQGSLKLMIPYYFIQQASSAKCEWVFPKGGLMPRGSSRNSQTNHTKQSASPTGRRPQNWISRHSFWVEANTFELCAMNEAIRVNLALQALDTSWTIKSRSLWFDLSIESLLSSQHTQTTACP